MQTLFLEHLRLKSLRQRHTDKERQITNEQGYSQNGGMHLYLHEQKNGDILCWCNGTQCGWRDAFVFVFARAKERGHSVAGEMQGEAIWVKSFDRDSTRDLSLLRFLFNNDHDHHRHHDDEDDDA